MRGSTSSAARRAGDVLARTELDVEETGRQLPGGRRDRSASPGACRCRTAPGRADGRSGSTERARAAGPARRRGSPPLRRSTSRRSSQTDASPSHLPSSRTRAAWPRVALPLVALPLSRDDFATSSMFVARGAQEAGAQRPSSQMSDNRQQTDRQQTERRQTRTQYRQRSSLLSVVCCLWSVCPRSVALRSS